MPFTIPNYATAGYVAQAEPDKVDFDILALGAAGRGVVTGCAVTPTNSGATLGITVAAGTVSYNYTDAVSATAGGTLTPGAANVTFPRFDLVTVNAAGAVALTAGAPSANPSPPAVPSGHVPLATVYIPAAATSITAANLVDKRVTLDATLRAGGGGGGGGSVTSVPFTTKTANYAATGSDHTIAANGSGLTMTLPSAVTMGAGRLFVIKNTGSANVTVAATAGTVEVTTVPPGAAYTYVSNGTNWLAHLDRIDASSLYALQTTDTSLAAVAAKLDTALTGAGLAGAVGSAFKAWRAAWGNRFSTPATILLLGDSNSVGYYAGDWDVRWTTLFFRAIQSAANQRRASGYMPTQNLMEYSSGAWTKSGTVSDQSTSGLGYGALNITPPGYIERTEVCDRFWVHYSQGTDHFLGGFQVSIDGVAQPAVAMSGSALTGGNIWDSGPLTRGQHTIRITAIDGFGFPCRIEGATFFDGNGNTSGSQGILTKANSQTGTLVRVFNGAKFGTQTNLFTSAAAGGTWWTDGLDRINPALVVVAFGTNEITAGRTAAQFRTDLVALVDRINTVQSTNSQLTPSYLFVVPHGTGANDTAFAPYRRAIYAAAADRGAAVVDRYSLMGYVGTPAADTYGFTSTLDGATRVHLSNAGQRLAGEQLASYLLAATGVQFAGAPRGGLAADLAYGGGMPTSYRSVSGAVTVSTIPGNFQQLLLTGNVTLTFATSDTVSELMLLIRQDATGGRTVTWPASVRWPGNVVPTFSSTADTTHLFRFTTPNSGGIWLGRLEGSGYTL